MGRGTRYVLGYAWNKVSLYGRYRKIWPGLKLLWTMFALFRIIYGVPCCSKLMKSVHFFFGKIWNDRFGVCGRLLHEVCWDMAYYHKADMYLWSCNGISNNGVIHLVFWGDVCASIPILCFYFLFCCVRCSFSRFNCRNVLFTAQKLTLFVTLCLLSL